MQIADIDKNFKVQTKIQKDDIVWINADDGIVDLYGVFKEGGKYRRMPEAIAKDVSRGVYHLHANTAGGRVRFVTDSSYVAIHAQMDGVGKMSHFAFTGSIGFDLYADNEYTETFVPSLNVTDGYESVKELGEKKSREICINFPLYSNVKELYIGVSRDAVITKAQPYRNEKPIVYYGSSITQGGCASRPGMSYQSIVSRELNCDFINLGFSGSARAEDEMIRYLAGLDMCAFVLDYDHNAPSDEHLKNTHKKIFSAVREKHADLPIIIMHRPQNKIPDRLYPRCRIINDTFEEAVRAGDQNVYLLDHKTLTAVCKNEGTVDGVHPTDFGFFSIARAVSDVLREAVFSADEK